MKYIYIIFFLVFSLNLFSQEEISTLQGRIIDEKGNKIENARVSYSYVEDLTDKDGDFLIDFGREKVLLPDEVKLIIFKNEYEYLPKGVYYQVKFKGDKAALTDYVRIKRAEYISYIEVRDYLHTTKLIKCDSIIFNETRLEKVGQGIFIYDEREIRRKTNKLIVYKKGYQTTTFKNIPEDGAVYLMRNDKDLQTRSHSSDTLTQVEISKQRKHSKQDWQALGLSIIPGAGQFFIKDRKWWGAGIFVFEASAMIVYGLAYSEAKTLRKEILEPTAIDYSFYNLHLDNNKYNYDLNKNIANTALAVAIAGYVFNLGQALLIKDKKKYNITVMPTLLESNNLVTGISIKYTF